MHPALGTLELRVPDTQTTCGDAAAVAAFAQSLIAWLGERADAGEALPVHDRWRIEQNRWSANRHGVEGALADLETGERRPTRERLLGLVDRLDGAGERILYDEDRPAPTAPEGGRQSHGRAPTSGPR